jgi:tRNA pseudouridine55 synthase
LNLHKNESQLPYFKISLECDGGFYVRSLVADIGYECGNVAHVTELIRTKQSSFTVEDCLFEKDWQYDKVIDHIATWSEKLGIKGVI